MTTVPLDLVLSHAVADGEAADFVRLNTTLADHGPTGTALAELRLPGRSVEVEWLHPFSWDHADRGVVTATRRMAAGQILCLHAGPYGTADAAARLGDGRLRVVEARDRPGGWAGKVWAMAEGVRAAGEPEFLLFTDADIGYAPGTVTRLVRAA